MVELVKERGEWKVQDVDLKGLVVPRPNLREVNMKLLHRFSYLDSFQSVQMAQPFMRDPTIIEVMVLKELQELPKGFQTFFPFQCDLSS